MDRLDTLRLFVRVVASGSFSAAAREAGMSQSAVSKRIASLEQDIGARLVQRTSRSLVLTEAGRGYVEAAARLVADFDALQASVGRGQAAPAGHVRITLAPVFGSLYVVPLLPEFLRLHPGITVELSASDRRVDLVKGGFDVGVRHGELADSGLTARRLATMPSVTVATPAYLAKCPPPAHPRELDHHVCLVRTRQGEPRLWMFQGRAGPFEYRPQGPFMTTDGEQLRAAALASLGVAHGPWWLFAPEIASGALNVLLQEYEGAPGPIHAIHPFGSRPPARVRAVIDFLASKLAREAERTG